MDRAKQREIASKGGQSVPAAKRSFSQDRRLAAEAGRKGGQSSHGGGRRQAQAGPAETAQQAAGTTRPPAGPGTGAETPSERREPATAGTEQEKVESH